MTDNELNGLSPGEKTEKLFDSLFPSADIEFINEAAEKFFVGNAQILRKLQAVETALMNNAKIVVPSNAQLVNMIGEMAGVVPLVKEKKQQ